MTASGQVIPYQRPAENT